MPPRKRTDKSSDVKKSAAREASEKVAEVPNERTQNKAKASQKSKQRKQRGVEWLPVFKKLFYVSLLVLVPMLLNYAALQHEHRVLIPEVVLDAPIGKTSTVWSLVQPLIAQKTRVCSYDRAGLGFSDRAFQNTSAFANDFSEAAIQRDRTHPSTIERMVEDLHILLTVASSQPKPFILVSSDFITLASRFYAQLYEYEVAGLFMIDPASESLFDATLDVPGDASPKKSQDGEEEDESDVYRTPWAKYWYRNVVPHLQSLHLSGSLGYNRLGLILGLMSAVEMPELVKVLPEDAVRRNKHLLCQPKHLSSSFDEYYFINESISQIKTMFHLKPFPESLQVRVAVYRDVKKDLSSELTEIWSSEQQKMLHTVHPASRRVALPGSDYLTLYQRPETVARAVWDLAREWREHSHLAE